MKKLIFLTLLCLFFSACSLGNSQEVNLPTPVLEAPTILLPQSVAPSPTATKITEITAVATVTSSIIDNSPPPNNSLAQFHNLHFAAVSDGLPQVTFAAGTEEVFAIWDYANLSGEDEVRRVWTKDGVAWLVREEAWDAAKYGSNGTIRDISIYDFEGNGLASGTYQLTLYVNGVYQTEAAFEIQAAKEGLSTATETQAAWIQDGSILMLEAWDGSQRELAQAHEIVELLWFLDGRHLLYVDQQEPADPDGPPWPQHALWLVDTETAEQWQLGTPAEDFHRIGLSPDGRFIRTLPGSDFGDACFMDRRLVFVELDENFQRVALYDLHDFDSVLSDKPYWFFPAEMGKWVSEHEYEVNLTAFCMSAEMGTSAEDLALIGRYRLNLVTGTAVKVSGP